MESSSHITGDDGGEGCNSCESGWTMYLVSPMHGDDDAGGISGGKGSGSEGSSVDDGYGYIISDRRSGKKKAYEDYADADDDDSLASDASTGPAKVKSPPSPPEGGKEEDGGHGRMNCGAGKEEDEQEGGGVRTTKFPATSRNKKAGKVDKGGEGNSSRRGNSKKGSSSRRSFFLW